MIRKVTGIGTSHIKSFIFTKRCSIIRQQRLTTLNSVNQAKDFLPENKDKIADAAFGKSPTSTFFLGGLGIKESETEVTASAPSPTK